MTDTVLTRDQAIRLQLKSYSDRDLLLWTVCEGTTDYPGKVTARPHSARTGQPLDFILVADTFDAVSALVPPGLHWMPRDEIDPAVIVGSWI